MAMVGLVAGFIAAEALEWVTAISHLMVGSETTEATAGCALLEKVLPLL
jgi:hypothetical protein